MFTGFDDLAYQNLTNLHIVQYTCQKLYLNVPSLVNESNYKKIFCIQIIRDPNTKTNTTV